MYVYVAHLPKMLTQPNRSPVDQDFSRPFIHHYMPNIRVNELLAGFKLLVHSY